MAIFRDNKPRPIPRIIVILAFLAGIGLTWMLKNTIGKEMAFGRSALRVEAQVVALREVAGRRGPVFVPVFQFSGADGKPVTVASGDGSNPPAWSVGEVAQVLYDPAFRSDVEPDTIRGRWGSTMLMGLVTCSFWAAGILGLRTRGWRLF